MPQTNRDKITNPSYEKRKLYYREYYRKNRERILKLRAKQVSRRRCRCRCTCGGRRENVAEFVAPITNTCDEVNGKRIITIVKKRRIKTKKSHSCHRHSVKKQDFANASLPIVVAVLKHTGVFSFKKMFGLL